MHHGVQRKKIVTNDHLRAGQTVRIKTRPLLYSVMCLLAAVVTGFNYLVLMREVLEALGNISYWMMEFLPADARQAAGMIILPEYQYIPLLVMGLILMVMFVFQIDFFALPVQFPSLLKIIYYATLPMCCILTIIPISPIIAGCNKGYIPIPTDAENYQSYTIITLLFLLMGLCTILIFLITFAFSVYWEKNLFHLGLLFFPAIVFISYCSLWWGRFLFSLLTYGSTYEFLSFLPILSLLVVLGQGSILISIFIFIISLFSLIKRKISFKHHPVAHPNNNGITSVQFLIFITIIVFVPLSVVGWFIPYFLIAFTEDPLHSDLNVVTCLCVILGGVLFYLWARRTIKLQKAPKVIHSD